MSPLTGVSVLIAMQSFAEYYYKTFDSDRALLAGLYCEQSVLSIEGERILGAQAIIAKLSSLPFQRCQHRADTVDWDSLSTGGLLVFVTGVLMVSFHAAHYCYVQAKIGG